MKILEIIKHNRWRDSITKLPKSSFHSFALWLLVSSSTPFPFVYLGGTRVLKYLLRSSDSVSESDVNIHWFCEDICVRNIFKLEDRQYIARGRWIFFIKIEGPELFFSWRGRFIDYWSFIVLFAINTVQEKNRFSQFCDDVTTLN